jgi:hypothetical protein
MGVDMASTTHGVAARFDREDLRPGGSTSEWRSGSVEHERSLRVRAVGYAVRWKMKG